MKFFVPCTKVFAVSTLIFLNVCFAQTDNDLIYHLPAGTKMRLRMDTEINSKAASVDDTFIARIAEPVSNRGSVVIPIGTIVEGRVLKASSAGVGGEHGELEVRFESLKFEDEQERDIEGVLVNPLRAESNRTANILSVVGFGAAGAIFGAVSKAENGAMIGAAVGSGAGAGVAYLRKGKEVRIKTSEEFEIELKKDVTLPVRDF